MKAQHGGKRPGAGRKPQEPKITIGPVEVEITPVTPVAGESKEQSPLEFLLAVMRSPHVEDKLRLDAAKAAAMYVHLKKGDGGIKDERAEKAKKAAVGKFGAAAPPKLIVNNR